MEYLNIKNIPTYLTQEQAVKCFIYMYQYDNNMRHLRETPGIILKDFTPDIEKAEAIIGVAAEAGRQSLYLDEAVEVLKAYGIPAAQTLRISNEEDAMRESERIGYPVVLKIASGMLPDRLQKGGVLVNLKDGPAVRKAFASLRK